ncbi:MAG TPA: hypothetical protein ENH13_05205 [Euryarchaeota archaeon]|nr:hypothetical protein [Euryarchaeota archaeon]HDH28511.1 hypothetical protein [Euryarchaeota archaeon]
MIRISLLFVDDEKPEFNDLFIPYPLFFKYLFATIILSLARFFALFSLSFGSLPLFQASKDKF